MEAIATDQEHTFALKAKIGRISRLLTPNEVAAIAGVSPEDVDLFQRSQAMNPVARRRLLDAYLFKGTINRYLFNRFWTIPHDTSNYPQPDQNRDSDSHHGNASS